MITNEHFRPKIDPFTEYSGREAGGGGYKVPSPKKTKKLFSKLLPISRIGPITKFLTQKIATEGGMEA